MGGSFACPECGEELALAGLTPGREIQCAECSTWVEVPYIPRAVGWKSRSSRKRRNPVWTSKLLRFAVVLMALALVGVAASKMIGSRVQNDRESVLTALIASADQAEGAHDHAAALYQIEAAVVQARSMGLKDQDRLTLLIQRRDQASLRDVQARLEAVDALDPDRAVGEALILEAKARRDQALAPLADSIAETVNRARVRQAETDLAIARKAFDAGQGLQAFTAADRLYQRADRLPDPQAKRFLADAQGVVEAAIGRYGVTLPAATGRFLSGSPESYALAFDHHWREALEARGYLITTKNSPWITTWEKLAPFQASCRVVETQEEFYLQSKNRTTQIEAFFELTYQGKRAWQSRVLKQTRQPLLDLPAYQAGRLATSDHRNPEVERMFYDDALKSLIGQAAKNLRALPDRAMAAKD